MKRFGARLVAAAAVLILLSSTQIMAAPFYKVTYNGNGNTGGNVPLDKTRYVKGQTVKVAGNIGNLTRTGFKFDGWNTAADLSKKNTPVGSTFKIIDSNVTLYAKWFALTRPTQKPAPPSKPGVAPVSGVEKEKVKISIKEQANGIKRKGEAVSSTLKRAGAARGRSRLALMKEAKNALKVMQNDFSSLNALGAKLQQTKHLAADIREVVVTWQGVLDMSSAIKVNIQALQLQPCTDISNVDCASEAYLAACIECCNQRYKNDAVLLEQSKAECQESFELCQLMETMRKMAKERELAAQKQAEEDQRKAEQAAGG